MAFETTYYFCPEAVEPATEGQNMKINRIFEKYIADGKKYIREADGYAASGKYDESIKSLKNAKDCFSKAIDKINETKGGPLAATIIGMCARALLGTYKMFTSASALKKFKSYGDYDWSTPLLATGVVRVVQLLTSIIPGVSQTAKVVGTGVNAAAAAVSTGVNISRRLKNSTDFENTHDGKKKRFSFNGFREDCMFILNAYIKTTDNLIQLVEKMKATKEKGSIIKESLIEDLV